MTLHELNQLRHLRSEIRIDRRRLAVLVRERPEDPAETAKTCGVIAERMKRCSAEIDRLEAYIEGIDDSLTRQAFALRFSDGLSWRAAACWIGGGNTADGIRMQCVRYLQRNSG